MGRHRSRSRERSYSPRHKRYDDPRDRRRSSYSRRSPAPCGLLVRNVALDTRPEDLRIPFEKFGPVKDVYLPRNYYTGEPRGFGFVKFRYPEDAAEAKDRLNHAVIGGREIRIVYAEENRKTPQEMRKTSRTSGRYGGRRTPPRSPRRQYRSYSRSPSSHRRHSRSVSRSPSPRSERYNRSTRRSLSPRENSPCDERGYRTRDMSPSPRDVSPREGEYKSRRSDSPRKFSHDENQLSSRMLKDSHEEKFTPSRMSPRSREISPHYKRDLRSSQRSVSSRDESRRSLSPRHFSGHGDRRGIPLGPNDLSPVDERDYRSNRKSISPENSGNPPNGKTLASSRS